MLGMDIDVVVPGHGPVTDKQGIVQVRDYLSFIEQGATARFESGMDAFDAARDIAREMSVTGSTFASWGEAGRISVNVETAYRALNANHQSPDVIEQFRRMAQIERG
jgi:acyl-CoA thioesterase FadM